jgi:hypothetical protein
MLAGRFSISPSAGMHTYSACVPNLSNVLPKTSSPTWKRVTPLPKVAIVPENSIPRILILFGRSTPLKKRAMNGSGFRSRQSAAQTVVA